MYCLSFVVDKKIKVVVILESDNNLFFLIHIFSLTWTKILAIN